MKRLLLISTALIALTGVARADFVAVNGVEFNMLNLTSNNNPVLVSSGTDGADSVGHFVVERSLSAGPASVSLPKYSPPRPGLPPSSPATIF